MTAPTLPLDLPHQPAPPRPIASAVRCRFCRKGVGSDPGTRAWRICDDCWHDTEFSA